MAEQYIVPVSFEVTARCGHTVGGSTYPNYLESSIKQARRYDCMTCRQEPTRFKVGAKGGRR